MADKKFGRDVIVADAAEWAALQRVRSAALELLDASALVSVKENELRAALEALRRINPKTEDNKHG